MKGWYGNSEKHMLASKGIATNTKKKAYIYPHIDKNIFSNISWLESSLRDAVAEEIQYQYDVAKDEMVGEQYQFKYLNDFEYLKDLFIMRLLTEHNDGIIENYIPDGFEYLTENGEYVNRFSIPFVYLDSNSVFTKRLEEIYEEEMQDPKNFEDWN